MAHLCATYAPSCICQGVRVLVCVPRFQASSCVPSALRVGCLDCSGVQLYTAYTSRRVRGLCIAGKFKLYPPGSFFVALKGLLDDFTGLNVDMCVAMVEGAGRFLLRSQDTRTRMDNMLEVRTHTHAHTHTHISTHTTLQSAMFIFALASPCSPLHVKVTVCLWRHMVWLYAELKTHTHTHTHTHIHTHTRTQINTCARIGMSCLLLCTMSVPCVTHVMRLTTDHGPGL